MAGRYECLLYTIRKRTDGPSMAEWAILRRLLRTELAVYRSMLRMRVHDDISNVMPVLTYASASGCGISLVIGQLVSLVQCHVREVMIDGSCFESAAGK